MYLISLIMGAIQKTWQNGSADAFAGVISRLPLSISELFDYSQVLYIYDDFDTAQVVLSKGLNSHTTSTATKMEKRLQTHLKAAMAGRIFCFRLANGSKFDFHQKCL